MMWWLVPLVIFLLLRNNRRRWHRRRDLVHGEHESIMELRKVVEDQRSYIDDLEGRLARVEDGLEFAERLLADRGTTASAG
ncbi:MAG TPA: hypothetical protein VMY76_02885 [Gemmatimonadales bacterium]|nr:hypothetical protein [Gemmatimonadales bacterium]